VFSERNFEEIKTTVSQNTPGMTEKLKSQTESPENIGFVQRCFSLPKWGDD